MFQLETVNVVFVAALVAQIFNGLRVIVAPCLSCRNPSETPGGVVVWIGIPLLTYWWVGRAGQSFRSPFTPAIAPAFAAITLVFWKVPTCGADRTWSIAADAADPSYSKTYSRTGKAVSVICS